MIKKVKVGGILGPMSGALQLRQKSGFAVQHLMAASRFSRMCGFVEKKHLGKDLGNFFDEQIAFVTATIMLSTASLEANINEYLSEIETNFPELNKKLQFDAFELIEKKGILEKYQYALAFKGVEKLSAGEQSYQDANALIKIRNALVHFKPEWHDEQKDHKKLEKLLVGKFPLSPFIAEKGVFFPQKCMSYGCTQWSVKSALTFMKKFSESSGLPFRFSKHLNKINTEL